MRRFSLTAATVALGLTVVFAGQAGASKGWPHVGQPLAVWKAYYGQHPPKTGGFYGAPVHNDTAGSKGYFFSGLSTDDGIVDRYSINLPNHTSLFVAEEYLKRNMPKDATVSPLTVIHTGADSCAIVNITSMTLDKIFAKHPNIGDPLGVMGVNIYWINGKFNEAYSPNNVQVMDVSPVPAGTSSCA